MSSILVADDEAKLGKLIAEALTLEGHAVTRVTGGRQALAELSGRPFDVVVTDLRMPEVDGLAVLHAARGMNPPAEVILMTAYGTAENAVAAMKAGAADYLTKPFSMDELRLRVQRLASQRASEARSSRLLAQLTPSLVAESPAMAGVMAAARQVASTDATVLLLGESGTGKSQLARFIHYESRRAAGPWVEVHCAALPEALLESELFGLEKGVGHLAAADGGTLFLDEIGEVTASTQAKLLHFLQERELVPMGTPRGRKVDTRVIAATNRDLAAAVREGSFREDFFYRLNVFSIEVPPLRERRKDLLALAERFLAHRGLPPAKLAQSAREALLAHSWPGNVRELENALERALILAGEAPLTSDHFAFRPGAGTRAGPGRAAELLREGFNLDEFERELIYAAIERSGGNKAAAARLLGITRRRLYSRLESLDAKAEAAGE